MYPKAWIKDAIELDGKLRPVSIYAYYAERELTESEEKRNTESKGRLNREIKIHPRVDPESARLFRQLEQERIDSG